MTTSAYRCYDVPGYIAVLAREGELLGAAAGRAGMTAAVPSCPGWAVRDLLKHTSHVHRWAADIVTRRLGRPEGGVSETEILAGGPDDTGLPGWFRDGHAALVRALSQAPQDLDCWAFLAAPSPLAFWARRQAHETAIHRVDAEQAAGAPEPEFDPAFAADGVDELLMGFLARNIRRGSFPGLGGSLAIHAADGPDGSADWLVTGGPGTPAVCRGGGPADCAVSGPAASLYLTLWNRRPAGDLRVTGDPAILAALPRGLRITW